MGPWVVKILKYYRKLSTQDFFPLQICLTVAVWEKVKRGYALYQAGLRLQAPKLSQAGPVRLQALSHGKDWVAVASEGTGGKHSCHQKSWQDLGLPAEGPAPYPDLQDSRPGPSKPFS